MLKKFFAVSLMGCFVIIGCAPSTSIKQRQSTTVEETKHLRSEHTGPKRRVGVIDFENKTTYGARLGQSATDILITELVKTNRFIVVERDKMNKLLEEQKLGLTGVINPNTVAKAGKLLGLNAIITGSISQFGAKKEGSDYLITQSKRQIVEATVDIRVVDVETGQILYADSGKGVVKKGSGKVLGMGTKSSYDETLEGEALRAAIVKFVDNIVSQISARPWSCRVAMVKDSSIYLNAGILSGLKPNTVLIAYHLGEEIIDPTTGISLGNTEEEIGSLKIERNFGEDGSIAKLVAGQMPSSNDICRLKQ
ncbi:MAG: CsgG/HfaB family protein [bacterium]